MKINLQPAIDSAKSIDLISLAGNYTKLSRASGNGNGRELAQSVAVMIVSTSSRAVTFADNAKPWKAIEGFGTTR